MRKLFVFFLWLFLLLFVLASFYISFTAYLYERDAKLLSNVSAFFIGVQAGRSNISLPYPEYTVIIFNKRSEGKVTSSNVGSPVARENYVHITMPIGEDVLYMYVKKINFRDYIAFVSNKPLYIGLLTVSLLLYMSIFYFTLNELQTVRQEETISELLGKLKALRLTLATFKVIPEESLEEMKKIVDSILKQKTK